jgi:CDP-diacylglycerol--serine O-phosphatidyltransferase
LLDIYGKGWMIGNWKYALVVVMIILSLLMFSSVPYPSFKGLAWGTRRTFPVLMGAIVLALLTVWKWHIMLPTLFLSYLAYGLVRPWISKNWVKEIEEEPEVEAGDLE